MTPIPLAIPMISTARTLSSTDRGAPAGGRLVCATAGRRSFRRCTGAILTTWAVTVVSQVFL